MYLEEIKQSHKDYMVCGLISKILKNFSFLKMNIRENIVKHLKAL